MWICIKHAICKIMLPVAARSTFLQNGCKQNWKHIAASENQNFYCMLVPLKILILAYELCNISILDPLRKREVVCCTSIFLCRRALHHYTWTPSHMASQNLSIGSFCMKLRALLYEGIGIWFYDKKHHHTSIPSHIASQNLSLIHISEPTRPY